MIKRMKIKTQLILAFILMFVFILALMTGFISRKTLSIALENTEHSTLSEFKRMENNISLFQEDMEKVMLTLLFDPLIKEFCSNDYGMDIKGIEIRKEIGNYLDMKMNFYPEIASIFIETSDGNIIGTEKIYNYNTHASLQKKKEQLAESPQVMYWEPKIIEIYDVSQQKRSKVHVISLCGCFFNTYKDRYSIITINIKEEVFRSVYENTKDEPQFSAYVCNEEGVIISNKDHKYIFTKPPFIDKIFGQKQNGSFVYQFESRGKIQIIYNAMDSETGWIIIKEIPLKLYRKDVNDIITNIIVILLATIFITILFSILFIKETTTPINLLVKGMQKVKNGEIGYNIEEKYYNEFGLIIDQFNEMSTSTKNLMEENQEIEKQKRQYMTAALKAQINPHFLFNTINMVRWMAIAQRADNIQEALEMLMAILKPVFKRQEEECSIREEITYSQNYIKLINLRFSGRIELDVQIGEDILDRKIPCFLFQPIIENCVEHGFYDEGYNGVITITAHQGEDLQIYVCDNGKGMEEKALSEIRQQLLDAQEMPLKSGDKIGLVNVHIRIRLRYGADYGLSITSGKSSGTCVIIKIPQI